MRDSTSNGLFNFSFGSLIRAALWSGFFCIGLLFSFGSVSAQEVTDITSTEAVAEVSVEVAPSETVQPEVVEEPAVTEETPNTLEPVLPAEATETNVAVPVLTPETTVQQPVEPILVADNGLPIRLQQRARSQRVKSSYQSSEQSAARSISCPTGSRRLNIIPFQFTFVMSWGNGKI